MPRLEEADLSGKKIALYGLGDQVRWPLHFVDAMGELYKLLKSRGYDTVAKVPVEGYTFDESEAVVDGKFAGLPVDEDFQPDMTDERVKNWVGMLRKEFS